MQKRGRRSVGGCSDSLERLGCAARTCSARTRVWALGLSTVVAAAWHKPAAVAPPFGALALRDPYQSRQQLLLFSVPHGSGLFLLLSAAGIVASRSLYINPRRCRPVALAV